MKTPFYILLISAAVVMVGCTQPSSRASFYKYTEKNAGAGSLGIHSFRHGDTLWSVANAYHVDLRDMLDLNNLSAPYHVKAGQRLRIPAPLTYKAHNGDTLYRLSRMFDTSTTELARLNDLRAPYSLKANQILKLPSKHAVTAPVIKTVGAEIVDFKPQPVVKIQREELSPTQQSNVVPKKSEIIKPPNKENREVAEIATPLVRDSKGFLKPVSGKIISGFGTKADGLHNDGINIKATRGDAVRSAEQGVVVYSGNQIEGYGNMVLIRHADGYMTAYAHMDKSLVQKGDKIKRGQAIGTVGSTGHVDAPQLHFEIRKGKEAVNPSSYISL